MWYNENASMSWRGTLLKQGFYENAWENTLTLDAAQRAQHRRLVLARTVVFPLMAAALVHGYDHRFVPEMVFGGFLLLLFVLLVARHHRLERQKLFTKAYLSVIAAYLSRFSGDWKKSPVHGGAYLNEKRPPDRDLHIFGTASLYQYLCCARTQRGRDRLAAALSAVPHDLVHTRRRQAAVAELIAHPLLCLELEAYGAQLPDGHDTMALAAELRQPQVVSPRILRAVGVLGALAGVSSCVMAGLGAASWTLPLVILSVNIALALLFYVRTVRVLAPLGRMAHELRLYGKIFRALEAAPLRSDAMRGILSPLVTPVRATQAQEQLARIAECTAMRRNFVFFILANALFLWDFHCTACFAQWRGRAGAAADGWFSAFAEMEVLLSLASIGHTREVYAFATFITDGTLCLDAVEATSLLLPEKAATPNDAHLAAGTLVITGSNMSGKTTYMRVLGSNAVLAYAGGPVCARSFSLTPMAVYTSIQISDDLTGGISTFYAELLRIKRMIEYSKGRLPMLILIDEIFRGTNSADRIVGAREAIRRLTLPHAITIVTTHDFELCTLQRDGIPVQNAHFEEHYEGDKILFDFRIREGRCQTTNAQYLLRMAGIMGEETDAPPSKGDA